MQVAITNFLKTSRKNEGLAAFLFAFIVRFKHSRLLLVFANLIAAILAVVVDDAKYLLIYSDRVFLFIKVVIQIDFFCCRCNGGPPIFLHIVLVVTY